MSLPVTVQITRDVDPGAVTEVEDWVARGQSIVAGFPGYLGSGWVRAHEDSTVWHMLLRFSSEDTLRTWADSPQRHAWMAEFHSHVREFRHVKRTGIEGWFDTPQDDAEPDVVPPRWKQAIVIFTGFYPVSALANYIVGHVVPQAPFLVKILLVILLATPTMVYWVLPWTTRLYQPWLNRPRRTRPRRRNSPDGSAEGSPGSPEG